MERIAGRDSILLLVVVILEELGLPGGSIWNYGCRRRADVELGVRCALSSIQLLTRCARCGAAPEGYQIKRTPERLPHRVSAANNLTGIKNVEA